MVMFAVLAGALALSLIGNVLLLAQLLIAYGVFDQKPERAFEDQAIREVFTKRGSTDDQRRAK